MDNRLRILIYLAKSIDKKFTMHELSRLVGIPYATFYRTVQEMPDLLSKEQAGKSTLISIIRESEGIVPYLTIASLEEKKESLARKPIIRKIAEELISNDIVILFGSYAKGKETELSDIDILVVNKNGKRSISFSKYEVLFGKKINPVFVTEKEFKLMLKDKEENVGKQALRSHIVLKNAKAFWEAVFDGIQ